jgi:hypothetical protein
VGFDLDLQWPPVILATALVFAAYAVLIEAWRRMLTALAPGNDAELGFGSAARIWFVSNLGRYVPGKVWSNGAMAMLAHRAGV